MHDMSLERTSLDEVLSSLGALLASRREAYGLLVVGGSNLLLLGLIDRPTGDLDVIGLSEQSAYRKVVELPEPLRRAAAEVGLAFDLSERWSTLTRHRLWTPSFRRDGENGSRYADMALSNCTSRHGSIRSVSSFGLLSMLDRRANTSLISLGCHRQTPNSRSPLGGRPIVTSLTRSRP